MLRHHMINEDGSLRDSVFFSILAEEWPEVRRRLEAGLETILVLTGVTTREETELFPYRPSRIVESVAELIPEIDAA